MLYAAAIMSFLACVALAVFILGLRTIRRVLAGGPVNIPSPRRYL